jgi:hypothetical protein
MLTAIAIANAILWSGVITALLFGLLSRERSLESRLARLESKVVTETPDQATG